MKIKLAKHSLRSQKYRIFVPVEYFDIMGYTENDVLDVDIIVKSDHMEESSSPVVPEPAEPYHQDSKSNYARWV